MPLPRSPCNRLSESASVYIAYNGNLWQVEQIRCKRSCLLQHYDAVIIVVDDEDDEDWLFGSLLIQSENVWWKQPWKCTTNMIHSWVDPRLEQYSNTPPPSTLYFSTQAPLQIKSEYPLLCFACVAVAIDLCAIKSFKCVYLSEVTAELTAELQARLFFDA